MPVQNEAATNLATWRFRTEHVQRELDPQDFINSATALIAAGPPRLVSPGEQTEATSPTGPSAKSAITGVMLFPIGIVENMTIVSNRQLQILFEIGSKRQFYIPGRVIPQITLARTLFNGPNILRALYAWYPVTAETLGRRNFPLTATSKQAIKDFSVGPIEELPGYADFWPNMNSDLFDRPFGLLMILKDQNNKPYGSFYLENAFINNHQMTVNASSTLVAEGSTIQFERIVPVDIGAVAAQNKTGSQVAAGATVT